jgi:RNA polymerase sigma-70 factor (ECF subfamily)
MKLEDETLLIERAKEDPEALRVVFDHYFPRLYSYVSYRVGHKQDTEDLVSDIFLRVVDKIRDFEWQREGSFGAWIFSIARNLVIDFYRKNQRRGDLLSFEKLTKIRTRSLQPEETILLQERFELLRELLHTLSPRRQEVILLRFYGGLRNNEISLVMKLDERTVSAHLHRGLKDLYKGYEAQLAQEKKRGHHE